MSHAEDRDRLEAIALELQRTVLMLRPLLLQWYTQAVSSLAVDGAGPDLTLRQALVLMLLRQHGDFSLKRLAEAMSETPSSASSMVERLVEKGLVTRGTDREDRRRVVVALCPDAVSLAAEIEQRFAAALTELLRQVEPEQAEQLEAMCASIQQHGASPHHPRRPSFPTD